MTEEKKAGSEVIVTLSHTLSLDRSMVMQFAIAKDATKSEKSALLDEMREIGERQMAFGELDKNKMQLKQHLKNAELCRSRLNDIEDVAKMAYSINGGGKRGPYKLTEVQQKAHHANASQLEDIAKQVSAIEQTIEKLEKVIADRT